MSLQLATRIQLLTKACLHRLCNLFATGSPLEKKLKSLNGCKGRGKVFLKSPTSRRLKLIASCLSNMHKRLAATEFDREEVAGFFVCFFLLFFFLETFIYIKYLYFKVTVSFEHLTLLYKCTNTK